MIKQKHPAWETICSPHSALQAQGMDATPWAVPGSESFLGTPLRLAKRLLLAIRTSPVPARRGGEDSGSVVTQQRQPSTLLLLQGSYKPCALHLWLAMHTDVFRLGTCRASASVPEWNSGVRDETASTSAMSLSHLCLFWEKAASWFLTCVCLSWLPSPTSVRSP